MKIIDEYTTIMDQASQESKSPVSMEIGFQTVDITTYKLTLAGRAIKLSIKDYADKLAAVRPLTGYVFRFHDVSLALTCIEVEEQQEGAKARPMITAVFENINS